MTKVAYLCDRNKCPSCNTTIDDLCHHTEDIEHAVNFEKVADGVYMEKEEREFENEDREFEWCHDCAEYDTDNHCCHRWTKVIRQTVEEMKTDGYAPVRHGHWIDIDEQSYTWKIRCSVCGHERSMISTQGKYPNYCENCGAKMDEGE